MEFTVLLNMHPVGYKFSGKTAMIRCSGITICANRYYYVEAQYESFLGKAGNCSID
jgi:hypothetical protein